MTTGQPIRFPSDRNKYNNEFNEALQLQINLNQTNLEANRLYKETGQLPASTQMMDTRSNEEKLADVHNLKQSIISDLRPIAEPMFASAIIQGVINSPLNVDNSLFRYLAQNASMFAQTLSKKYKFGIAGDANDIATMIQFLEDAYVKTKNTFQSIKGYINSNTNEGNRTRSTLLSANDTDNIKNELKDIQKRTAVYTEKLVDGSVYQGRLIELVNTLGLLDRMIPTSDQMQQIINDISEYSYRGEDMPDNELAELVFDILDKKIPKLSSVQTLLDRLNRAFNEDDTRSGMQCIDGLRNLFGGILFDPVTFQNLIDFHDIFVERADRQIQQKNYENQVQATNTIAQENLNRRMERNAQRVYVVNPADDAVNIRDANAGAVLAPPPQPSYSPSSSSFGYSSTPTNQPVSSTDALLQAVSSFNPLSSSSSSSSSSPAPPSGQMNKSQWDAYIDSTVRNLSRVNLTALYTAIPTHVGLRPLGSLRDSFRLKNPSVDQMRDACINALQANSGNVNYGPTVGVGNILAPQSIGLGLSKPVKKGRGLYSPFGDSEINHKNLENNILTLRRKSKTNYMDLPSKHISKHMKNILHSIVGGKIANFEDIQNLNDEERNYLNKVISKSNLHDRLSIPAPSKDQADKDSHGWEVMRGEIMAGNDSHELVKKFKILTLKLTRQGLLPKNEVMELFEDLVNLGY